jgi:tRNA A37 threonylcarbamoyltransferase TsaD
MNMKTFFPEKTYSTDNGAMIGAYALKNPSHLDWKKMSANPELYFA